MIGKSLWDRAVPDTNGCLVFVGSRTESGYGQVLYRRDGLQRKRAAHRAAWELQYGPIPDGMVVCHHCDNPPCINPEHLFLGTIADNNADRDAKGRTAIGTRNGVAKLTPEIVRAIRAENGRSNRQLAAKYGVSHEAIRRVVNGVTWRHVREHR